MSTGNGRPPGRATVRLTAIVLNYETPETTRIAVQSLIDSDRTPDEVVVVDNSASAGGKAACSEGFLRPVTYLPAPRNLGFSGGMNLGIREALGRGAESVLLMNSDAAVSPRCIGRLEEALLAAPQNGIAGPRIQSRHSPGKTISLGLRYSAMLGRMRDRAADATSTETEGTAIERVDAVTGCVMLVRREVFQSIGLLDEDYFFSFEDLDFCLKAARAGYASVLARSATALHDGSRSIGPQSTRRLYFAARNHLLLGKRMAPTPGRVAAASRFAAIVALNTAHAAAADGGTLVERLGAVWAGTRDYLAGRYGNG